MNPTTPTKHTKHTKHTKIKTNMTNSDYIRLQTQIEVLKNIAINYSGKTIDNIIQQLEARKGEIEYLSLISAIS